MTDSRDELVARSITRPDQTDDGMESVSQRWEAGISATTRASRSLQGLSLRTRLVAILVVAVLASLAATGYGVQAVLSRYLVTQIDDELTGTARRASNDPTGGFFNGLVGGHRGIPSPFVIQVSVDGGSTPPIVIGGYGGPGEDNSDLPTFPSLTSAQAAGRSGRPYTLTATDGTIWRATSFASPGPVTVRTSGVTGPAAVTIAQRLNGVDQAVAQLRLFTLLIGALVILLCTMLGWLAIRRSFRPLIEVEETAAAIAAGDLSRRIPERPASTEVGRLTASLNGMLTQIESAFRAREASEARTRRFAADASHELRTPLASIRGFAELYRQGAVPGDEVPRTMRRIEDEAKRMGSLVEDLLTLARLDEQRPARHDQVDLETLARDAVHDAHGLDVNRPIRLVGLSNGNDPTPTVVIGDEDRLRQVIANLVANAIRHTPAGTPIEVAVGLDTAGQAVLEVRDHGFGLTLEQAELVFERFYRIDSSRQRAQGGGSGLGLSIVSAVVVSHTGTVQVLPTPGGGATFQVKLPATPAPPEHVAKT